MLESKIIQWAVHVGRMGLEIHDVCIHTGCGRKNSPIWEANKNQTKHFFKILNSIHNAVLKFKNYITQVATFIVDTLT
jgi:hypothetical protein